jgi:hypothetical protein
VLVALMVVNRCVQMAAPRIAGHLFGLPKTGSRHRVWLWALLPSLALGVLAGGWAAPPLYNAVYTTWSPNPYIGYVDELFYGDLKNVEI